ncbi:MAG: Ig domain-containing protein [Polyangiales bacterium]
MKNEGTRLLFALSTLAVLAAAQNASAQCPPDAPIGVNAVMAPSLTVSEGSSLLVSAAGGGPTFEWDADCDGVTASRGDGVFGTNFNVSAVDRDGTSSASLALCVRSVNPNCPAGMRQSTQFRTMVSVSNADPVIAINVLPNAVVGAAYNFTATASDPANPPRASMVRDAFTWSATGLPMGLSINAATGAITGTPAAGTAGTYTVRLRVADGDGGIAIADVPMEVIATAAMVSCNAPLITTAGTIAVGEGGVTTVSARIPIGQCRCVIGWDVGCDGTTEFFGTTYTLSAEGRDGPASARLCARSHAAGTGAMACAGASTETSVNGMAGININNIAPVILTSTLPNATVGSSFASAVVATDPANPPIASGIQDAFTWSAAGLPPGLSIDPPTGTIFGTPTMAGMFTIMVSVADGDGGSVTRPVTITIDPAAMAGVCPVATVVSPGPGGVIVAEGGSNTINATISGSACGCVIEWDVGCDGTADGTGASLPLSGRDRDGSSTFTVCHRTIPGAGGMCTQPSTRATNTVTVSNVAPTITTAALPTGTLGMAYTATLTASDPANPPLASMVRDPITWSAIGLPPGLSLDANTGVISGTPDEMMGATARCYPVTFSASDGDGGNTTRAIDLCVLATAPMVCPTATAAGAFTATEGSLANLSVSFGAGGACGCEVAWDFNCDGVVDATGPSTMFNTAGFDGPSMRTVCWITRPAGGMCNAASVRSTNALNVSNEAPTITTASVPMGSEATAYATTIVATDPANPPVASSVQDPFVWSLTGAPAWLSINAMTGEITGTPPMGSAGMSFTFTVSVTDGDMGTTMRMFTLTIAGGAMDGGTEAGVDGGDGGEDADATMSMPDAEAGTSRPDADAGARPDADAGSRPDADAALIDAAADGGMISGTGACACRVPAAPSSTGRSGTSAVLALAALATVAVARRRRR